MKSLSLGVLIGLVLGIVAVYAAFENSDDESLIHEVGDVRVFEPIEVERHRSNQFLELDSIESLQSLPGDFTRAEALYALCGRSNGEELVGLASEANRIADPFWRQQALDIILERLTQTAPEVAFELARSKPFRADRRNQATVLQTWAREDLVAAVSAVSLLDDRARSLSAQMIYSGIGGAYTADAMMVEDALGIAPSRSNRDRYVRGLATISPQAALDHVLGLDSDPHQHEQVQTIAKLYSYKDLTQAEQMADRIGDDALRRRYLGGVYDELARTQPMEAAKRRFAIRDGGSLSDGEKKAFRIIVEEDLDNALVLFESQEGEQNLAALGEMIAAEYVNLDPQSALEWAKSTPEEIRAAIVTEVIVGAAEADPVMALQEAGKLKSSSARHQLTRSVVKKLVEHAPQDAAELIGYIENDGSRAQAARQIADKWLADDPFVAFDWIMNADAQLQSTIFKDPRLLSDVDLYEAQTLVGSLPAEHRAVWARSVADRLIKEESPEHAVQFVSQFAGQPDHAMQMAHVVAKIADHDATAAMRWIDRIPRGHPRDGALSTIVVKEARDDPGTAVRWLEMIDDPDLRQTSAGSIATGWVRSNPEAAKQWLGSLQRGPERDNILVNASMNMYGMTDLQTEIIEAIDDPAKRDQAMLVQGMIQPRGNTEELIRRLDQMEMPDIFKQQIKSQLLRESVRGR